MTNNEIIIKLLNHRSSGELEQLLVAHIHKQVARGTANTNAQPVIAYGLAGLLSMPVVFAFPDEHPIKRVLLLAGQLELPIEQRAADATWKRLIQEVDRLERSVSRR